MACNSLRITAQRACIFLSGSELERKLSESSNKNEVYCLIAVAAFLKPPPAPTSWSSVLSLFGKKTTSITLLPAQKFHPKYFKTLIKEILSDDQCPWPWVTKEMKGNLLKDPAVINALKLTRKFEEEEEEETSQESISYT